MSWEAAQYVSKKAGSLIADYLGGTGGSSQGNSSLSLPQDSEVEFIPDINVSKEFDRIKLFEPILADIFSLTPKKFYNGHTRPVVFNNEMHVFIDQFHYKYDGSDWICVSDNLPFKFNNASTVVYNGELHILGGTNRARNHYKWDGNSWEYVSSLPGGYTNNGAVVLNNEIHIVGVGDQQDSVTNKHYKWNGSSWTLVSTLPSVYTRFDDGDVVLYNNQIHILGGTRSQTLHYKWNGSSWASVSTLPYEYYAGCVEVLNGKIHMIGGYDSTDGGYLKCKYHHVWDGSSWTRLQDSPFEIAYTPHAIFDNCIYFSSSYFSDSYLFVKYDGKNWSFVKNAYEFMSRQLSETVLSDCFPVVYNDEIHMLGKNTSASLLAFLHLKYDGKKWSRDVDLPYRTTGGASFVVYNNELHAIGAQGYYSKAHYKFNGTSWTEVSTLPFRFCYGHAIVFNNEIHIMGSTYTSNHTEHYKWNGSSWVEASVLPYGLYRGAAVVFNDEIHILGTARSASDQTKHYKWDGTSWTEVSTLPYQVSYTDAVVFHNELHILGGLNANSNLHYKWNGSSWVKLRDLPFNGTNSSWKRTVVYKDRIHMLGRCGMRIFNGHFQIGAGLETVPEDQTYDGVIMVKKHTTT